MDSAKRSPPAAQRNLEPILGVLRSALPQSGHFLEIASGSGYHVANFARAFPGAVWQPSAPYATARASIAAHIKDGELSNVLAPLAFSVENRPWPVIGIDAVLCINMIHISPWPATEALFGGAGDTLDRNGILFTYGPYVIDGDFIADSNKAFDANLKQRNPAWGLRELRDIETLAERANFMLAATVAMPANNFALVFRKLRGRGQA